MDNVRKCRKKLVAALLAGTIGMVNLTGCAGNAETAQDAAETEPYLGENMEDIQIFPTPDMNFVGDPMPYYEDGVFHIFYLADLRDGKVGYHPWALYETENFYEYEDKGEVIPYGEKLEDQDIALGTGSVIKDKDGVYHAFYTGHNDTYDPKEAVMHATSTDRINWTKIPEDTLYAGEAYSENDFRDPYVLYAEKEQQYWMIVSTRNDKTGVLAKYTSKDLKTWEDAGIFFENDMGTDSNLECATLLEYSGKWYLSFSDQWPDRQFHYRVSDKIDGPFEIPEQDVIDGNGFYAGRLETDGEHLYAFGWNGTKGSHMDSEDYDWGGNLVVHQLEQREQGALYPIVNQQIKEKMNQHLELTPVKMTETVTLEDNGYVFSGKDYEIVEFNKLLGSYLLEATISDFKDAERFGFAFNTDDEEVGMLNIVFDVEENKILFYNTNELYKEDPQSEFSMNLNEVDELHVSIAIADGVVSMYVNDQCAFTARVYTSQGTYWGIFGIRSGITCENIKIYK